MDRVASGLGDEIDDGTTGTAVLRRGVVGDDRLILKDVGDLGLKGLAADADVVDLLAVEQEVIGTGAGAVDLDVLPVGEVAALTDDLHAGDGKGELDRVEAEDGEITELAGEMTPASWPFSVLMPVFSASTLTVCAAPPTESVTS